MGEFPLSRQEGQDFKLYWFFLFKRLIGWAMTQQVYCPDTEGLLKVSTNMNLGKGNSL